MKRFVALWREAYRSQTGKQIKFLPVEKLERSSDFQIAIVFFSKRQRAGAVHDASRISGIIVSRTASWSAAALRRFSQRHIQLYPF